MATVIFLCHRTQHKYKPAGIATPSLSRSSTATRWRVMFRARAKSTWRAILRRSSAHRVRQYPLLLGHPQRSPHVANVEPAHNDQQGHGDEQRAAARKHEYRDIRLGWVSRRFGAGRRRGRGHGDGGGGVRRRGDLSGTGLRSNVSSQKFATPQKLLSDAAIGGLRSAGCGALTRWAAAAASRMPSRPASPPPVRRRRRRRTPRSSTRSPRSSRRRSRPRGCRSRRRARRSSCSATTGAGARRRGGPTRRRARARRARPSGSTGKGCAGC